MYEKILSLETKFSATKPLFTYVLWSHVGTYLSLCETASHHIGTESCPPWHKWRRRSKFSGDSGISKVLGQKKVSGFNTIKFFFWWNLPKEKVYRNKPRTIANFKTFTRGLQPNLCSCWKGCSLVCSTVFSCARTPGSTNVNISCHDMQIHKNWVMCLQRLFIFGV